MKVRLLLTGLVLAAGALALIPALAKAAPQGPWVLPATDLSLAGQSAEDPQVEIGTDGTAASVWDRSNGSKQIVEAAVRPPGGGFGAVSGLSPTDQNATRPQVAVGPEGTVIALWIRFTGSSYVVQAAIRPPGGAFGPAVDLSGSGGSAGIPQIAFGPDGSATAVWQGSEGSSKRIRAATRPPGGSFGLAQDLSASGGIADDPQVETGADGTTAVVWRRSDGTDQVIEATIRPPGGGFGLVQKLSESSEDGEAPQIAVAPDGAATAVWYRDDGSKEVVRAATRPAGGSFADAVNLSDTGEDARNPQVAIAADGAATAVWERFDGSNSRIQAATRSAGGPFALPVNISDPGETSIDPQLAIAPDGTMTVVWERKESPDYRIESSTRPPGGAFGSTVELLEPGELAKDPQIDVGPDGRATVVWKTRNVGEDNIIQAISTEVPAIGLGVTKDGTGQGTVTSSPGGIDCGTDCGQDYPSFTMVTLTANPAAGSTFSGWSGACAGAISNTCELTLVDPVVASATFEAGPAPPPPNLCPAKKLKLKKLKRNEKKGVAVLKFKAGGKGKVILKGSKKVRKAKLKVRGNGRGKLRIKAKGKVAKKLRKRGKVKLRVKLVYRPGGDCPTAKKTKKVRLVRR